MTTGHCQQCGAEVGVNERGEIRLHRVAGADGRCIGSRLVAREVLNERNRKRLETYMLLGQMMSDRGVS